MKKIKEFLKSLQKRFKALLGRFRKEKLPTPTPTPENAPTAVVAAPSPISKPATPDDQQLHPGWVAMGTTWGAVLLSGMDPRKDPKEQFKTPTNSRPDTVKDPEVAGLTSTNTVVPAATGLPFDRMVRLGDFWNTFHITKTEGYTKILMRSVPNQKGGEAVNLGPNARQEIRAYVSDATGKVVIESQDFGAMQMTIEAPAGADLYLHYLPVEYTGGVRFSFWYLK